MNQRARTVASKMDYITILLWFSFVWACLQILTFARRRRTLPPGPYPLPVLGSLFQLGNKPHESLAQLAKTYGPLMSIELGSVMTIVVSSSDMAKEVLQKHDQQFASRTVPDAVRIHKHHEASMSWLPSSLQWRGLRKLVATQMLSPQKLNDQEDIRVVKVQELIEYIREKCKNRQAVNIGQVVFCATLNMISNTMFSIDMAKFKSEGGSQEFQALVWGVTKETGTPNIADYLQFLRPLDPQGIRRRTATYFEKLDNIFDTIIDQRLQSTEQQNASNDVLNALLFHTQQESGFKLGRLDIKSLLKDVFVAGTDTSAATVEWAMTELLCNRDMLGKARLELKENINKDDHLRRSIQESDIARLPYLEAIVKETLRLHPPIPLLLPHRAEADVQICGFTVPRHSQVLVNAWAIGRDPDIWTSPTSFQPDRFLGSSVDFKGRNFEFIPFGGGRRICPGLPLAYRMVPLILASLLYSFDWELQNGIKPEDINFQEDVGLILHKADPLFAIPLEP